MSRDTSQIANDHRQWLAERCPTCGAAAGARCHSRSAAPRKPPSTLTLHAARGWRQRRCLTCKACPGEPCFTSRGRPAARPHTARLHLTRGELGVGEAWLALERLGASGALVRFSGGGGHQGMLESISIQAGERELVGWPDVGESELAAALAAPVWGRYASFRGQPRIAATLAWSVADRSLRLAGNRASQRFEETLTVRDTSRDTSPVAADDRQRLLEAGGEEPQVARRVCCRCGEPIAASARPEARYCGKRCRQAASRARLRDKSGRSALAAPERCAFCTGPMPTRLRPEARYCGKRCRQAASRARLALTRG